METIGIIGKGFVGNALFEGMKHAFNVLSYDKQNGWNGHWFSNGRSCDIHDYDDCAHVGLACSPKLDPTVMRVSNMPIGKETLDEQT